LGPCQIDACYENGSIKIKTIDGEIIPLLVNGYRLKIYRKLMTRKEISRFLQRQQLNVAGSRKCPSPF